jgi:hypothetical protein
VPPLGGAEAAVARFVDVLAEAVATGLEADLDAYRATRPGGPSALAGAVTVTGGSVDPQTAG